MSLSKLRNPSRLLAALALVLAAPALSACDNDSDGDKNTDASANVPPACRKPGRVIPAFKPGLAGASSSKIQLSLMQATPANPIQGKNTFVVMIKDEKGQMLDGLKLEVTTKMPDHNHGSPSDAGITVAPATDMGAGHYRISNIDFHMNGYWEVTVNASSTAPGQTWNDAAVLPVCLAG